MLDDNLKFLNHFIQLKSLCTICKILRSVHMYLNYIDIKITDISNIYCISLNCTDEAIEF